MSLGYSLFIPGVAMDEAQQRIVQLTKSLAEQGTIVLAKGGSAEDTIID
ncbi:hypothetical protein WDZ92_34050 [Nostoc sp. NIES-2111]